MPDAPVPAPEPAPEPAPAATPEPAADPAPAAASPEPNGGDDDEYEEDLKWLKANRSDLHEVAEAARKVKSQGQTPPAATPSRPATRQPVTRVRVKEQAPVDPPPPPPESHTRRLKMPGFGLRRARQR